MHEDVKRYADSNDVKGLRYIFVDCLDVDPTFEKYAEDFEYCKNVAGLFEAHVELNPIITNQRRWNDDYWVQLKTDLMKNFSLTRFQHMQQVAKVVYAEKIARITAEREQQRKPDEKIAEKPKQTVSEIQRISNEEQASKEPEQAPLSKSEEERRRVEEVRRQIAQENQRVLDEERREKERKEKERASSAQTTASSMESSDPKKVLGVVLVVVIILIIILIIARM